MKLGFSLPMAGPWATPDNQVLIAQRAEALGYHSLWVFQRLLHDAPQGKARRPLWGTLDEIRDDVARYAEAGLTELFLEGNFDARGASLDRIRRVMAALAPAARREP